MLSQGEPNIGVGRAEHSEKGKPSNPETVCVGQNRSFPRWPNRSTAENSSRVRG